MGCMLSVICAVPLGCASHKPSPEDQPPAVSATDGGISGKLVNAEGDAFDTSLAKDPGGAGSLRIDLISPDRAVVSSATPVNGKPQFRFEHVRPGKYELSVYREVRGQRTIAGSEPVTVDAGQVTPVTITLQVTKAGESATPQ